MHPHVLGVRGANGACRCCWSPRSTLDRRSSARAQLTRARAGFALCCRSLQARLHSCACACGRRPLCPSCSRPFLQPTARSSRIASSSSLMGSVCRTRIPRNSLIWRRQWTTWSRRLASRRRRVKASSASLLLKHPTAFERPLPTCCWWRRIVFGWFVGPQTLVYRRWPVWAGKTGFDVAVLPYDCSEI